MSHRRGEKVGWIGGWLGGFIWVLILSAVLLARGELLHGLAGVAIVTAAVVTVLWLAPWRHPDTPYWKLLVPIYGVFFASIGWALWGMRDLGPVGVSRWSAFLLLPILSPFVTIGRKRWRDQARHVGPEHGP